MSLNKRIIDIAWALVHPNFWVSVGPSCPKVDRIINKMIDHDVFVACGRYYAVTVDKHEVWVSNYPYGFGEIGNTKRLPYRRTRARLKKYLDSKFGADSADTPSIEDLQLISIEDVLDQCVKVKIKW